jgi:hypothetical protein
MSPHSYFIYPGSKCEKLQPPEGGLLLTCSVALQVKMRRGKSLQNFKKFPTNREIYLDFSVPSV